MEKMSCCINAYRPFTVITGTKSGPLYVYRGQRTISRSLFSAYTMWALGIKLKASGLEAKAFFFFLPSYLAEPLHLFLKMRKKTGRRMLMELRVQEVKLRNTGSRWAGYTKRSVRAQTRL